MQMQSGTVHVFEKNGKMLIFYLLSFTRRFHSILRLENEVSAVCSTALKANTLTSVMPSMVAAKSAVYYLAKYSRKTAAPQRIYSCFHHRACGNTKVNFRTSSDRMKNLKTA